MGHIEGEERDPKEGVHSESKRNNQISQHEEREAKRASERAETAR